MKKFKVLRQFTFGGKTLEGSKLLKYGDVIDTDLPPNIEASLIRRGFIAPYESPPSPLPPSPKGSYGKPIRQRRDLHP